MLETAPSLVRLVKDPTLSRVLDMHPEVGPALEKLEAAIRADSRLRGASVVEASYPDPETGAFRHVTVSVAGHSLGHEDSMEIMETLDGLLRDLNADSLISVDVGPA